MSTVSSEFRKLIDDVDNSRDLEHGEAESMVRETLMAAKGGDLSNFVGPEGISGVTIEDISSAREALEAQL
ncbi:hypothetical protein QTO30_10245 [Yoonia sp. GPGPB17]|uniref:hypothetical protein n=1 Tax=Yoonia sp. GPGPB17 TaxID=3026147 RepID=UPI0030C278CE